MSDALPKNEKSENEVSLLIKNPVSPPGTAPFSLQISLPSTVADLKSSIASAYPGQPNVSRQRLIFAGKLLADGDELGPVLAASNTPQPHTLHLVTSAPPGAPRRTPSTSVPSPSSSSLVPPQPSPTQPAPVTPTAPAPTPTTPPPQHAPHNPFVPPALPYPQMPYPPLAYPPGTYPYPPPPHATPGQPMPGPVPENAYAYPAYGYPPPYGYPPYLPHQQPPHYLPQPQHDPAAYAQHLGMMADHFAAELAGAAPGPAPAPAEHRPGFGVAFEFDRAAAAAAGVPAPAPPPAPEPPRIRRYVFHFELNWSLISKLVFLVVLLGQEGSSRRFYGLSASALVIYLWQAGRLTRVRGMLGSLLPTPVQLLEAAVMRGQTQGGVGSVVVSSCYVYSFIYGFICSLYPSWEPVMLPSVEELTARAAAESAEAETAAPATESPLPPTPDVNHEHAE